LPFTLADDQTQGVIYSGRKRKALILTLVEYFSLNTNRYGQEAAVLPQGIFGGALYAPRLFSIRAAASFAEVQPTKIDERLFRTLSLTRSFKR
jgi:hypothetical protein